MASFPVRRGVLAALLAATLLAVSCGSSANSATARSTSTSPTTSTSTSTTSEVTDPDLCERPADGSGFQGVPVWAAPDADRPNAFFSYIGPGQFCVQVNTEDGVWFVSLDEVAPLNAIAISGPGGALVAGVTSGDAEIDRVTLVAESGDVDAATVLLVYDPEKVETGPESLTGFVGVVPCAEEGCVVEIAASSSGTLTYEASVEAGDPTFGCVTVIC